MATIDNSFNIQPLSLALDNMVQQSLNIQNSMNISMSIALNSCLQPAIQTIENINLTSQQFANCIDALSQQCYDLMDNMSNSITQSFSVLFETISNNMNCIEHSFDVSSLNFNEISTSFNNFIDEIETSECNTETQENIIRLKNTVSKPSLETFDQWLNRISIILTILLSLANWVSSQDTYYQDEYLKVLDKLNSNLEQIILLESQK